MVPNKVNPKNAGALWNRLYHQYMFFENKSKKKPRYKKNEHVRLAKKKLTFHKGYYPTFTGIIL